VLIANYNRSLAVKQSLDIEALLEKKLLQSDDATSIQKKIASNIADEGTI
jgi:hypothetical protein